MNEEQSIYVVRMFRKDQEVFDCFESVDFSECKNIWEKLHTEWQECHKEQKVFLLKSPIISAFEPGLISEISILPKVNVLNKIDADNPYKKQMMDKGLSHSLRQTGIAPNVLDDGYL